MTSSPQDSTPDRQEAHLSELKKQVAAFPKQPGVYIMKDASAKVIYVGKAKDLRARVKSYFLERGGQRGDGRAQIEFLMRRVRTLDYILTETEHLAYLLERDLIQKHKPKYNIRLKDDKSYYSLRVDTGQEWPRIEVVRRRQVDDHARYFGPYSFAYEVRTLLEVIQRVTPLRTCTDQVFNNRQRPCLEYQIKRCAGPCCLPVDPEQYRQWVKQAMSVLEGRYDGVLKQLEKDMAQAAEDLRFEDAAGLRDKIQTLERLAEGKHMFSSGFEDRDVFNFCREEGQVTLAVLHMRSGRITDSRNYHFSDVHLSNAELLESSLIQFYEGGRDIPPEILIPEEFENLSFVSEVLSQRRDSAVSILAPQKGIKFRLLGLAQLNAKEHFIASFQSEDKYQRIARRLRADFKLRQMPRRIEALDISNFQGSDIVGAIVCFFDGKPHKERYRSYRISQQDKPDDFASVHEVVQRRLREAEQDGEYPDLLLIDGGKGQLGAALSALENAERPVDIISIAKMRADRSKSSQRETVKSPERIFIPGQAQPIILPAGAEQTLFLQKVRNEVHRFVITQHRRSRNKRVFRSALDNIPGIGPTRKARLLSTYGSIENIKSAPPEELSQTAKIPLSLAQKLQTLL